MLPYVWLRQATGEHRSIDEVKWFSADVYAYFTAENNLSLFGPWLRTFPRAEGDLFPGFTPLALAALAVAWGLRRALASTRPVPEAFPSRAGVAGWARRLAVAAALGASAIYGIVLLVVVGGAGGRFRFGPLDVRMNSVTTAVKVLAVSGLVALACSARARAVVRQAWRSPLFFFAALTFFAWWMSLRPEATGLGAGAQRARALRVLLPPRPRLRRPPCAGAVRGIGHAGTRGPGRLRRT